VRGATTLHAAALTVLAALGGCAQITLDHVASTVAPRPGQTLIINAYEVEAGAGGVQVTSHVRGQSDGPRVECPGEPLHFQSGSWALALRACGGNGKLDRAAAAAALSRYMKAVDAWQARYFAGPALWPQVEWRLIPEGARYSASEASVAREWSGVKAVLLDLQPPDADLDAWAARVTATLAHELAHWRFKRDSLYRDPVLDETAAYLLGYCYSLEGSGVPAPIISVQGDEDWAIAQQAGPSAVADLLSQTGLPATTQGAVLAQAMVDAARAGSADGAQGQMAAASLCRSAGTGEAALRAALEASGRLATSSSPAAASAPPSPGARAPR
jgi:hypothetical protein